jgi:hypothetical protein
MTGSRLTGSVDGRKETDSHANDASRLSRARGVRLGFGVLAFAAVTVVTCPIARYRIFTGFSNYDDEGYMLISLKSFLNHGWLYDGVAGYGPFYYEFWGAVVSIFGIPVDHDGGRTMTMVVWALSSLLIGLSTWRMTGSIFLGLATQLSVFEALFSLVAEPMHPGGIIVLLLSATMAFSCFVRDRTSPFSMALLGGAVMALILVKINVGIFALAAVVLVCVVSYPGLARRRWLRPVVEVGFVALPLLLMSSKAAEAWARHYALHVSAAALAVVIALRARWVGRRNSKELWWLGGGVLVVGVTVPLALLAAGTSPSGLIDGVIMLPLRFPSVLSIPLVLPNWIYLFDLLPLVGALGYWYVARKREAPPGRAWTLLVSALSVLIGLFMAFSVIGSITLFTPATTLFFPLFFRWGLLCFAWVALIQPPGKPDEGTQFARLLLPPLAVLQALHAFPVAGSQQFWSTLLLIPVGALCIANGVRGIAFNLDGQSARRRPFAIGAIAATVAMVVLVSIHLKQGLDQVRAAYRGSVSLGLPGAKDVRVSREEAANYQAIVAAIDKNCESFVMLPRMNSFYLWTQQEPPTGYDPTGWSMVFDDAAQQRVIEAIRSIDGLCLLENVPLTRFWGPAGAGILAGPLDRYLQHGFVPIAKFGDYQLLKREGGGSRS